MRFSLPVNYGKPINGGETENGRGDLTAASGAGNDMRQVICGIGAAVTLTACGGMIPGTIYSSDGKVLQFEIEKASRTGAVKARDASTGETFVGTYVGIREHVTMVSSSTATVGSTTATGFGSGSVASNIANATAYLQGDKGTMLNCRMKIEAGLSPHGIGECEDNNGRKYRLQF